MNVNDEDMDKELLSHPIYRELSAEEKRQVRNEVFDRLRDDPVHHPKHYTSHPSGVECIDITRHMNFNLGNTIKYIWRAGLKDSVTKKQDLEKAIWYLRDELEHMTDG